MPADKVLEITDERVHLSVEDAKKLLDIDDADRVHAVRGGSGIMIGADWDLADVIECFTKYGVELAGPTATSMRHGVVSTDKHGPVFFRTKKDPA